MSAEMEIDPIEERCRKIGRMLQQCRDLKQISQKELAKAAQVSSTYISQVERGIAKRISYTVVIKIATALGIPTCLLFAEKPCHLYDKYLEALATHPVFVDKRRRGRARI